MGSNRKPIDISIERRCPICGGKVIESPGLSFYGVKSYGIPIFLMFWYAYLDGRTWRRIEDITDYQDIYLFASIHDSFPLRSCEICNYIWDEFDETDFVLQSNDKTLIHNYMSLVGKSTSIHHTLTNDKPLSTVLTEEQKKEREQSWKINLIKAKIYQYQYKNQSDIQRNDDCDYKQLYCIALQNAEKYHTDNKKLLSYEYELRADMSDDILERFNLFNAALLSVISHRRKVRIQNNINELYSTVLDQWKKPISIEKRRIIFIANNLDDIAGFYDPTHSINHFFTIDRIPASIKFPYGGPTGNELYIANPVKPDEYVPYENYELALLMDKTHELKRLLRSLGATEITFTTLRGTKIEEAEKVGSSVNAEAGFLGHKANGGYSSEDGQNRMSSQGIKVDYIERLDSYEYPSLPDRLHWYNSVDEWKDIVEARLHHNQLHFEQSISTKQVSSLNEQSQMNVNAAYEGLISHINVNYHREREFHVKTTEESMWRITAEFKPLSEFENNQNTKSDKAAITDSSIEQEYIKAVKQLLEDGEISEPERHFLNKKRDKLGISEQRASELEASLATQLTKGEQVYLKKYLEYAETGEITEMQRHLLNDIAETYELSPERVKQLEAKK